MKKLNKILLSVAVLFVMATSTLLVGCNKKEAKLELTSEFKTNYYIGEQLDLSGGMIKYTNEEGKEQYNVIEIDMVSGFFTDTVGTRNMIITYNDQTILISYTVSELIDCQMQTLYYSENNPLLQEHNLAEYLYFIDNDTLALFAVSKDNEVYDNLDQYIQKETSLWTYTKTIVNNKAVYTIYYESQAETLSVINSNTIEFSAVMSGATIKYNFEKYVHIID